LPRAPERAERRQLAALEQLARVREDLGAVAYAILVMVVIEDRKWCEIAKQLGGIDAKTAKSWTTVAIRALAAI
jgi:hypothetical protein